MRRSISAAVYGAMKRFLPVGGVVLALALSVGVLYTRNVAPSVPEFSPADAVTDARPYIIKFHAQWCPICMVTRDVWADVEATYSGRAQFLVFDFTNEATTAASRREAVRRGLDTYFDQNVGWTGAIVVVDPLTKRERAAVHGVHSFAVYRAAIDRALQAPGRPSD